MRPANRLSRLGSSFSAGIRRLIAGERAYLEEQYRNLYGVNQKEKANDILGRNIKRGFIAMLILILLLVIFFLGERQNQQHFLYKEGEGRSLIGISRPESGMLEENITVRVERGDTDWSTDISARIPSEKIMEEKKIESEREASFQEEELRRQVESLLREAIAEPGGQVLLPTRTQDGTPIHWKMGSNSGFVYIPAGLLLIIWILFSSRYSGLKKEQAEASRSVERDLPLFLNQLVLLLNAGSIFEGAFIEIIKNEREKKKRTYFYAQLELIRRRFEETRDPLDVQLAAFARRTGNQDFIRIAGIIRDNLQRGILLSEKLLRERNDLMHQRKKRVEEEIRVKETRLTMPLCLNLLVLIGIAIGPAILTS